LDGNVKRVLARHRAIDGWPGQSAVAQQLWQAAEEETPTQRVADYTQAIMDLGATLCTRSKPDCERCPVAADCSARKAGNPEAYPGRKPRRTLPTRARFYPVVINAEEELLLLRRPAQGLWGGLWCLPEFDSEAAAHSWLADTFDATAASITRDPPLAHSFSHFHLTLQPLRCRVGDAAPPQVADSTDQRWFPLQQPVPVGLPAPVAALLDRLRNSGSTPKRDSA
jgi:A/G-specific adenine glycosylase